MPLQVESTPLAGVRIVTPRVFEDNRGQLSETFNRREFFEATGIDAEFVQDIDSRSVRGVLRGLHFQNPSPQGKLIRCSEGEIFDVIVDIRGSSPTFGAWTGVELTAASGRQLWIPDQFAHGFLTLSATAHVVYKTTDYYTPSAEHTIAWNDPDIGIEWPLAGTYPILSVKDAAGTALVDARVFN